VNAARIYDRDGTGDRGFTLIELLVVIIIIGILASIAIPVFLSQKQKARAASAQSDVRNLAGFEELYLTDAGTYGNIAAIQLAEPKIRISSGVTLSVVVYDTDKAYCLSAKQADTTTTFYYDSQAGGVQPKGAAGCPVTVTGVAGDSATG
jgi:prepilin-type N-terminal cleavage/methylation domain-containing protein